MLSLTLPITCNICLWKVWNNVSCRNSSEFSHDVQWLHMALPVLHCIGFVAWLHWANWVETDLVRQASELVRRWRDFGSHCWVSVGWECANPEWLLHGYTGKLVWERSGKTRQWAAKEILETLRAIAGTVWAGGVLTLSGRDQWIVRDWFPWGLLRDQSLWVWKSMWTIGAKRDSDKPSVLYYIVLQNIVHREWSSGFWNAKTYWEIGIVMWCSVATRSQASIRTEKGKE